MPDKRSSDPEVEEPARDQRYRHSLRPQSTVAEKPVRLTSSQRSHGPKKRVKTTPPPSIPEIADISTRVSLEVVNEHVNLGRTHSKGSKGSRNSKASSRKGVDNPAFETERDRPSRNSSPAASLRSSTRDPSVQSLTVVREQYCCYSKRTPCERTLFATVIVLVFIIILLVITVILISVYQNGGDGDGEEKSFLKSLLDFNT